MGTQNATCLHTEKRFGSQIICSIPVEINLPECLKIPDC